MQTLSDLIASIQPLDEEAMQQARERQQQLTKPAGSLGLLEDIAVQVAGITSQVTPTLTHKAVVVMAADHGVTSEGVSAYPAEVTPQMVLNFLHGGAAINALARQADTQVVVVDIGVASGLTSDLNERGLLSRNIAPGTANMAIGPAMTREQALAAINVGVEVVESLMQHGTDLIATGEMGIGNTTASSAVTAALTGVPVSLVTGRGTGLDDAQLAHKIAIIERALSVNKPDAHEPLDVLTKVGGLEIAGLVGVILASASHRIPVVVDGFISGAAALVAVKLQPLVHGYLFAGHVSVERGHHIILEHLTLTPLLDLHMRLGEGTGAVLATHILEAALRTHKEMATFGEAGVSEAES